jgi:hypothetical protein
MPSAAPIRATNTGRILQRDAAFWRRLPLEIGIEEIPEIGAGILFYRRGFKHLRRINPFVNSDNTGTRLLTSSAWAWPSSI